MTKITPLTAVAILSNLISTAVLAQEMGGATGPQRQAVPPQNRPQVASANPADTNPVAAAPHRREMKIRRIRHERRFLSSHLRRQSAVPRGVHSRPQAQ